MGGPFPKESCLEVGDIPRDSKEPVQTNRPMRKRNRKNIALDLTHHRNTLKQQDKSNMHSNRYYFYISHKILDFQIFVDIQTVADES